MSCENHPALLDDLLDGTLPAPEARALERHLEGCPACRSARDALQAIVHQARALPRERLPARDLWPDLRARLAPAAPASSAVGEPPAPAFASGAKPAVSLRPVGLLWQRWRARLGTRLVLAPAALVLLLGAGLVAHLASRPATPVATAPGPAVPAAPGGPSAAGAHPAAGAAVAADPEEGRYRQALLALREAVDRRRPALAPATLEIVDRNLAVIDEALREIEQALRADPGNPLLGQLLRSTRDQKLALVERLIDLVERS